jgi:hypothetical protein
MLFNIILGLSLMGLGLAMLKFWRGIYNFTGAIDFVERWVAAGTPAFIRIVGVVLVVFGLGMTFGIWTWLTQPIADGVKSLSGAELNK